jgi:hypothetical protein
MRSRSWHQDNSTSGLLQRFPQSPLSICTVEDHCKEIVMLEERFRKAWTFPDTQKILCVIPALKTKFRKSVCRSKCVQHHTHSTLARWRVSSGRHQRICNLWIWQKVVACVCVTSEWHWNSTNILASLWPSKSLFIYPSPPDILWVPASKVFTKVDPETAAGYQYAFICYQWKGILLHHCETRHQASQTVNSYSYR